MSPAPELNTGNIGLAETTSEGNGGMERFRTLANARLWRTHDFGIFLKLVVAKMALSWETLQALLKEITTNVTNLKNIDFKNLTVKDVIVLLGTAYSLSKTVYGVISIYRTVKDYGVARMLKPNFKKFGAWASKHVVCVCVCVMYGGRGGWG